MELEEGIYPIILKAYRLSAPNNPKWEDHRDVVVVFGDERVRNDILKIARHKGSSLYQEAEKVFRNIPLDVIQMRRKLKMTTQKLKDENYKYKWLMSGKLCVYHKGQQYLAWNEESGEALLQALKISLDTNTIHNTRKITVSNYTKERQQTSSKRENMM